MKKKFISMGLMMVAVVGMFLAACEKDYSQNVDKADSNVQNEKTIVSEPTELNFIFQDGDETGKAVWTRIVRRFNEQYSNITINIVAGNGASYSEILKTKESIGEFPDILETGNAAAYIRAGKLVPLPEDIVSLFLSPVEFEGEVYTASCASSNTCGIIYNKIYFKEHNLNEPGSYEEFLELCEKIQELGDMSPLVIGGQDIWHLGFWFNKVYSDQVLSKDENFIEHCYLGEKDFSDPSFKAALEELTEIFVYAQEGWNTTPDAQIASYLVEQNAAMVYTGTHMIQTIENMNSDFEMGWFAIPDSDGKIRLTGGNTADGLAISTEAASDPDKKAAAEEFIRFFFLEENYRDYCETLNIMVPTTKDAPIWDRSPVVQQVVDTMAAADSVNVMWNEGIGNNELPVDFRDEVYVSIIALLEGESDMDATCDRINESWSYCRQNFNPVLMSDQ